MGPARADARRPSGSGDSGASGSRASVLPADFEADYGDLEEAAPSGGRRPGESASSPSLRPLPAAPSSESQIHTPWPCGGAPGAPEAQRAVTLLRAAQAGTAGPLSPPHPRPDVPRGPRLHAGRSPGSGRFPPPRAGPRASSASSLASPRGRRSLWPSPSGPACDSACVEQVAGRAPVSRVCPTARPSGGKVAVTCSHASPGPGDWHSVRE